MAIIGVAWFPFVDDWFDARALKDIDSDGSDAADAFQDCFSLSENLAMPCKKPVIIGLSKHNVYYL